MNNYISKLDYKKKDDAQILVPNMNGSPQYMWGKKSKNHEAREMVKLD